MRPNERAVRPKTPRYRLLAETMPLLVWAAGPDGSVNYVNARFYEFTGAAAEALYGSAWEQLVHADDLAGVRDLWVRSLATREGFEGELRLRRADGSYSWFLQRALPNDASGPTRWLGTMTEIDDQKRSRSGSRSWPICAILSSSLD
jgi:PAS domain S-box-containing protein